MLFLMQTGTAFASVDAYVVQNQSGDVLFYDLKDLKTALTNSLVYGASSDQAKLWANFGDMKKTGKLLALHDDSNGYIDYNAVKGALLQSVISGTAFTVDGYTQGSSATKATGIPATLKKVEVQNGTVGYSDYNNNGSSSPSFTLVATATELIGNKSVSVTLNTQNDTNYKVTVNGIELQYSATKDQFVGLLETNLSQDALKALTVVTLVAQNDSFEVTSIE